MGTRADFYVGRGEEAEWLGSVGFDGYPAGIESYVFNATTEQDYREAVTNFLDQETYHATKPEMGWPWPWGDSRTTDYAYAFEDGKIYASSFGHPWFVVDLEADNFGDKDEAGWNESARTIIFPNMRKYKNVAYDQRSGAIFISRR